jgi:RNA polymerase primary sigma factor
MRQRIIKMHQTAQKLEKQLCRQPGIREIAAEMGVGNPRHLQRLLLVGERTLSLNRLVSGRTGDSELVHFIEDEETPSPIQQVQNQLLREEIHEIMHKVLLSNEIKVLKNRFGLEGTTPQTLQSLADEMKVSRERVRQIEKRALRKLRQPCWRYKLKDYLSLNNYIKGGKLDINNRR